MKKLIVILLIILSAVVVLPLAYRNAQVVTVDYFFGNYDMPLAWVMFGTFILGVFLSLIFFAISGLGWKIKAKGLKKQIDELLKQRKRDEIEQQFKAES